MPVNSFDDYPMSWRPTIDRNEKPLYLFLANQLEKDIKDGVLLPGTKLPPQRELADYLDVNVSTISKAFKACELKGLLSATVGCGTFVSFDALSNAYLLDYSRPKNNVIEMGATLPDSASYEPILMQLKQMLNEHDYVRWFNYARPDDVSWQKDAAVKLMKLSGYSTSIDRILFANGAQNAIMASIIGLCTYGDKIGTDPHTLAGLKTLASMVGVQLVPIRQKDGEMDPEALIYACRNDNIKGIYLIPDCHNPTTHRMSRTRRRMLAEIAREHDIFIIEDAMLPLLYKKRTESVASFAPDNTIYISSMAKIIAPGLRMAYISVPARYKKTLSNALYNINISVSPLISELVARIIVSGAITTIVESHRKNAVVRNKLVNHYLGDFDCHGTDTCIFRWLQLPPSVTGTEFELLALREGVQVYAAERFTVGNSTPFKAVRVSICAVETTEELERGLMLLRNLLNAVK